MSALATVALAATDLAALAPLQTDQLSSSTAETIVQLGEYAGAILGLFIAYQAYRGYRRNDSRPMLYMALGFVVIFAVPLVFVATFLLGLVESVVLVQGATQLLEFAGLVLIIYALRVDP